MDIPPLMAEPFGGHLRAPLNKRDAFEAWGKRGWRGDDVVLERDQADWRLGRIDLTHEGLPYRIVVSLHQLKQIIARYFYKKIGIDGTAWKVDAALRGIYHAMAHQTT